MRVLVIGTVRQAHEAIKDMGHEIVLFIKRKSTKDADIRYDYEKLFVFDNDAENLEYVELARTLHKIKPFDAVCSFNDDTQGIAIEIADLLGLFFPVDKNVLDIAFNKGKTREVLRNAGLDDTECYIANDESALRDLIGLSTKKKIIKPTNATASLGISIVENKKDLDNAITWLSTCGVKYPVIVEDFLEGDEYSVESMSENSEHFVLAITKKIKDKKNFVELGHTLPAELKRDTKFEIESFIKKSLDAIGIKNGPAHTEIIVTNNGPRIIETHTRGGGDRIFQLVELATGINILEMIARQGLGERVMPLMISNYKKKCVASIMYLAPGYDEHTIIKSLIKNKKWQGIEGVVELTPIKEAGSSINVVTNSFDRTALAIATSSTAEKAESAARDALSCVELDLHRRELS